MLRNRSGMALVLTLLAVSFLIAVTVQLSTSVNWQLQAAANQAKNVQLDAMLLSGLNLARAALLSDQQENEFDTALDDWGVLTPEALAGVVSAGTLQVQVTDLSGRLQINSLVLTEAQKEKRQAEEKAANKGKKPVGVGRGRPKKKDPEKMQRALWQRFLLSGDFAVEDEDAAAALLDSLTDWLDPDDDERENGAELGYYSSLNPPYAPANGPVLFPGELQLVKNWNDKLLHGEKEHSGIIDYLTIYGQDGKININTAPSKVLQALNSEMTEELATDLIDFRSEEGNRDLLAQPDWYHRVSGFPGDISFDRELVTISSNTFQIKVTALLDGLQRTGTGVVLRRENQEQVLLYWQVD
jgi:general secretion pathway protein K